LFLKNIFLLFYHIFTIKTKNNTFISVIFYEISGFLVNHFFTQFFNQLKAQSIAHPVTHQSAQVVLSKTFFVKL
jgi:hypothetical protein